MRRHRQSQNLPSNLPRVQYFSFMILGRQVFPKRATAEICLRRSSNDRLPDLIHAHHASFLYFAHLRLPSSPRRSKPSQSLSLKMCYLHRPLYLNQKSKHGSQHDHSLNSNPVFPVASAVDGTASGASVNNAFSYANHITSSAILSVFSCIGSSVTA